MNHNPQDPAQFLGPPKQLDQNTLQFMNKAIRPCKLDEWIRQAKGADGIHEAASPTNSCPQPQNLGILFALPDSFTPKLPVSKQPDEMQVPASGGPPVFGHACETPPVAPVDLSAFQNGNMQAKSTEEIVKSQTAAALAALRGARQASWSSAS